MSKAQAMLEMQAARRWDDPTPNEPEPLHPGPVGPPPHGPLFRFVRQRDVRATTVWRPWWLRGLLEVVTHPLPRYLGGRVLFVPGLPASCGLAARPALLVAL